MHYILFIPPPWVWLDLLSTFVLTPFLIFTEEDPDFVSEDVEYGFRSAPISAYGVGPIQDAFTGAIL